MTDAQINFVKQQGFDDASARTCAYQYPALMLQPRIIGVLALVGVLLQAAPLFLTVSAILWWSALVPQLNPFDKLYNGLVAARRGLPPLTAAPGPRRFAQGRDVHAAHRRVAARRLARAGVGARGAPAAGARCSDLRRVLLGLLRVPSPHRERGVCQAHPALGPRCVRGRDPLLTERRRST
jgi:hypothetical protein